MLAEGVIIQLMDGMYIETLTGMRKTSVTVYSPVEIQTQSRQLKDECTYLKAVLLACEKPSQFYP